jgi:threonine/homoserine/homoserine lactone efflux protein
LQISHFGAGAFAEGSSLFSPVGSGLGLAIVEEALKRANAHLVLRNRQGPTDCRQDLLCPVPDLTEVDKDRRIIHRKNGTDDTAIGISRHPCHAFFGRKAMLQAYLMMLTAVIIGQIAPGPNLMAVAGAALGQGRRSAFFLTLGVATAIFIWVTVAAFGLATLLKLYPSLLTVMKILGGSYLCFLAVKSLVAAWRGGDPRIQAHHADWTPLGAWRRGLLVNLTNPKAALLWSAVATFLYGAGLSTSQVLGFAPVGFSSAVIIYGVYSVLFSSGLAKRAYARFARGIEILFGCAFGAIGGKLVVDAVRDVAK